MRLTHANMLSSWEILLVKRMVLCHSLKIFVIFVSVTMTIYLVKNTMDNFPLGKSNGNMLNIVGQKYIAYNLNTSYTSCGGLGNMLFRIGSLYTIGERIGRKMYFLPEKCLIEYKQEFGQLFHRLFWHIKFIKPNPAEYRFVDWGNECCCCLSDIKTLLSENSTFLQVNGNYFQSFKYYKDGYKSKIRKLFAFSAAQKAVSERLATNLFGNDTNHKFCVHTRRGEFYTYTPFYSTKKRTEMLLHFVLALMKKKYTQVSLVLLGKDKNFINTLNIENTVINRTYVLEETRQERRNDEFVFAILNCDSFLQTAASTYSWWIAFLMREGSPQFFDRCPNCKHINHRDYFPYEWIPLEFVNGTVQIVDYWEGDANMF